MNLQALFCNQIPATRLPSMEIALITQSSRDATPNSLFVCIRGAVANGHRYAADAYARGCRAFVAEEPLELPDDAVVVNVPDTRQALALLAARFYGEPSKKLRVIGITGTKGKTTTAHLIAHLCNSAKIPCGYIGTNGISFANNHTETKNTTPDPLTLQKMLAKMADCGMQAVALEVSSQALLQARADGIQFEAVMFTNLSPDHIGVGEHTSFDDYKACKKRLFSDFSAKKAIFWQDDPCACEMIAACKSQTVVTCSAIDPDADYHLSNVRPKRNDTTLGIDFDICKAQRSVSCYLPLLGAFNAQNACLAVALVKEIFDLPTASLALSLRSARVPGRAEQLPIPSGACVCIDYAHNAFSLQALLVALRQYQPRRLTVLFGSVGGRTQIRRREMGAIAAKYADYAILTSDNPACEAPEEIIADIAKGFGKRTDAYVSIPDRKKALLWALKDAKAGDILVLAGKGHENYQLIGNEKIPFCERTIVEDYIATTKQKETVL